VRALLFTNLFPSFREPTRGLFNLHRFQAVAELCPVRVVAPVPIWRRLGDPVSWLEPPAELQGGLPATYPTNWTVPRVAPRLHAEVMYRSVRSHVRALREEFPYDVILGAFGYPDVVVAARLARDAGCPLVALVMGSDMNVLARLPGIGAQIRHALGQSDRVIALSAALKQKVIELGIPESRVVVQRNGVDGKRFSIRDRQEARRRLGVERERRLICFVGNLVHEKGPDVLLEAVGRMNRQLLADVEVVFVGDGVLKHGLASRAERLGLSRTVRFVGRRSPNEIPFWLAASDCLCLPSRREGCPNVVLEALASGRPVVASAVGGVPELLNQRNGILVPSEDSVAMASALTAVLEREWSAAELRSSVGDLSWQSAGRTFHDVLGASLKARAMPQPAPRPVPSLLG
jgi:glycosyltransferase involved in cell wall biosynthesis